MKQVRMTLAALAVCACLFTGCSSWNGMTHGNVSTRDDGVINGTNERGDNLVEDIFGDDLDTEAERSGRRTERGTRETTGTGRGNAGETTTPTQTQNTQPTGTNTRR